MVDLSYLTYLNMAAFVVTVIAKRTTNLAVIIQGLGYRHGIIFSVDKYSTLGICGIRLNVYKSAFSFKEMYITNLNMCLYVE